MHFNCSNLLDLRNLQEQVKKAFCYQTLFWPFTVWINCPSDLKNFANSRPSASNFKSFFRSLEQFFLTVGQNNFGNKIPLAVGGFSKILRNFQSGSWQMLTSAYKVGVWGEKRPKTCLRNIWMVPKETCLSHRNPGFNSSCCQFCFEPIFEFLRSFWFEKHRSTPWNRFRMFSELSGCSVFLLFLFQH